MPGLVLPIPNIAMNLALNPHWPQPLYKGISFLTLQSSKDAVAPQQLLGDGAGTGDTTSAQQAARQSSQALYAFRSHISRAGRGEPGPHQQQHRTKQSLCQDLALKSLKIWCSQRINNHCLTASPSGTSTLRRQPRRPTNTHPLSIPSLRQACQQGSQLPWHLFPLQTDVH